MISLPDPPKTPDAPDHDFATWESLHSSLQPVHPESAR
jgi:hypothetical protein